MSQTVDVYVTNAELEEARKAKHTKCMKIDQTSLVPVHCVSKQGVSTSTLFAKHAKHRSGRNLTDAEMGLMYDKFVGPGSLGNAAVRHEQYERSRSIRSSPSSDGAASVAASRAPSIDSGDRGPPPPSPSMAVVMAAAGSMVKQPQLEEEYQQQASTIATMKYVSPNIAKKYGIQQHIRPAAAAAAAAAASTAARMATGVAAAAAVAAAAGHGGNGGEGGASERTPRPTSAYGSRPPRPPSASFGAVSRDQAQRTGSFFVYGGASDVPAPGKYSPQYSVIEKVAHVVSWGKRPSAGADGAAGGGSGGASKRPGSAPAGGRSASAARPASAKAALSSPSGTGSGRRASEEGPDSRTHSHDSISRSRSAGHSNSAPQQPHGTSQSGAVTHGSQQQQQQQQSSSGAAPTHGSQHQQQSQRHSGSNGHHGLPMDAKAQRKQRHAELFAGAHRVHPPKPARPPGSQPFLATARKTPYAATEAGTLFAEYYWDGYDSLTRKSPKRPSSAFHPPSEFALSAMRQAAPAGGTGPALGPGAYNLGSVPATNTGKHVPAGHPGLSKTPDWSRTSPRPVSAPAVRPTSAAASHQGYWGPEGPTSSLFPDDPYYREMVALRALQERTQQHEQHSRPQSARPQSSPSRPKSSSRSSRPQSARAPSTSKHLHTSCSSTSRPQSARPTSAAAKAFAAAAAFAAASSAAAPGQLPPGLADYPGEEGRWGDTRPLVYVDPQRHGELGSAGLAKRVPGGAFGQATRQGASNSLRAMSQPNITPPSSVAVKDVNDLTYRYDYAVEAHRSRQPAWSLPPNRTALSNKWVAAAATAYLS